MEKPETRDELIESLRGNRTELLLRINDNHPGETPKSELSNGVKSIDYHLNHLVEWDLIEVVERVDSGPGLSMRVFKLTDEGKDAADLLLEETDARPIPSAVEQRINELRREFHSEIAEAREETREARAEAQEAQERVDKLKTYLKTKEDDVENQLS